MADAYMTKVISKVLEIDNCPKNVVLEALYKPEFWEMISPVTKIEASFPAPNVLRTKIVDHIKVVNIDVELDGELVLLDKGEEEGKGRLIQFNVRNNKDVTDLEGNIRVRALSSSKSKIGVFIHNFTLSSDFISIFGGVAELVLRTKITGILRNIEKYCKVSQLSDFL